MKDRSPDPRALSVIDLCKEGAMADGSAPLAAMDRLTASFCAATDASASWQLHGQLRPVVGGEPEVWLELQARADVPLECQRCLQPMNQSLQVQRQFRFVRSEDEAARLDEESEEDVLVLQARLDALELLEDELILALPIVPRHDACPAPLALPPNAEIEEEAAPHPFAALAVLRGRSGPG